MHNAIFITAVATVISAIPLSMLGWFVIKVCK